MVVGDSWFDVRVVGVVGGEELGDVGLSSFGGKGGVDGGGCGGGVGGRGGCGEEVVVGDG